MDGYILSFQPALAYAIGDGTTPQGNTHIVCFGGFFNHIQPEENIHETKKTVQNLAPGKMDIQRLVCYLTQIYTICNPILITNRSSTTGARMNLPKEHGSSPPPTQLLSSSLEALRRRHGNILFANSDWAVGWRSFIDGAIEEGTRAAMTVKEELKGTRPIRPHL